MKLYQMDFDSFTQLYWVQNHERGAIHPENNLARTETRHQIFLSWRTSFEPKS